MGCLWIVLVVRCQLEPCRIKSVPRRAIRRIYNSASCHWPGLTTYPPGWDERNKPGGDGSLGEFALPVIDIFCIPFYNERL